MNNFFQLPVPDGAVAENVGRFPKNSADWRRLWKLFMYLTQIIDHRLH